MVEGIQSVRQVTSSLLAGRTLFLVIHILGIACFAYIIATRLVSLLRAERNLRFDRPLARPGKILQILARTVQASALQGNWESAHSIFAGFILLAMRAFTVLIVGVSENFVLPVVGKSRSHSAPDSFLLIGALSWTTHHTEP